MSKFKLIPALGLILGGASGTIYSFLFIKLSLDYIKYLFFLIDFPTTFLVMGLASLTGKHEDALKFYLFIGPLVGAIEGYLLGIFLEKLMGMEIFSGHIVYSLIGILLLFNIIPLYYAYFTVNNQSQTNLYNFYPKEIKFNSYRLVIFRIEQDPEDISKSKIVYTVFDSNKDIISTKKIVVEVFKDTKRLDIPIDIDYLNSEVTFPVIDAPYTIKLQTIQISDGSIIQKTYKLEQEILVCGFQNI